VILLDVREVKLNKRLLWSRPLTGAADSCFEHADQILCADSRSGIESRPPRTGMQQVDHWIAFWEDVEIE
jgi:hypothetical protein